MTALRIALPNRSALSLVMTGERIVKRENTFPGEID
jgi:hypothetical protein